MRVLITGGAGFIGSHMVDSYLKMNICREGHVVVVIDNMYSGRWENIGKWYDSDLNKHFFMYAEDLLTCDIKSILTAHKIDIIHHFAARPRVKYSVDYPFESNENNVTATLKVLQAAKEVGVKRVVYSASSSAYGNTQVFPTSETEATGPLSPYALQKLVGEEYCRMFSSLYGLDTVCLRYFNVFGPRSLADSQYSAVIPIFIQQIFDNQSVTIDGTGEQSRDFTYVDNVIYGNWLAANSDRKFKGESINMACGDNISINGLVKELELLLDKKATIVNRMPRPGDAFKTQAAIQRAMSLLGYRPQVTFSDGLRKTVEWYLKYLENK